VLGEFAPEVEALIDASYPGLRHFLLEDPLLDRHSLLFEFVSPNRAIVLRAQQPALFLLGYLSKDSIQPAWDAATLGRIRDATAIAVAPLQALPTELGAALAHVRSWKGREGVVARFIDARGAPRLIKIKAEDYLRLHAYRSRLSGARALKLAWLLGLEHEAGLFPGLARYGLDWEAAEFARTDVVPYLARRRAALERYDALRDVLEPWAGTRARADKRAYVDRVRGYLATSDAFRDELWFMVAMRLYDAGVDDARIVVDANVLDEPALSLRAWRRDPDAEIRAILTAPVREDDG
jgi:hypothetical protein